MTYVNIKDRCIGDEYETVFLAEVNSAFDQNLEEGKRMIKAAAEAGADFLKAEILRSTDIVLNDHTKYFYNYGFEGKTKSERWFDIVKRKVNTLDFYREMFEYSRKIGLEFIVSVYDLESINFLVDIDAAAIKIPSSNLNHEPLIQAASETKIPLVLDTGKAYLGEVGRALTWTEKYGAKNVIINHHPGQQGSAEIQNLKTIQTYKKTFNIPVGLSCHYVGDEVLYTAIGMGANLLEKPISFNPSKADIDTNFAINIKDLKTVIKKVKCSWQAIGRSKPNYIHNREMSQEMCVVAKHDLSNNSKINIDNFMFAWPCKGISVEFWSRIKDKTLVRALSKGELLSWGDINFG